MERKLILFIVSTLVLYFETQSPCVVQAGSKGNPSVPNHSPKQDPGFKKPAAYGLLESDPPPLLPHWPWSQEFAKIGMLVQPAAFWSQEQAI